MKARYEIAARIAHNRHLKFLDQFQSIFSESLFVGTRKALLVDTSIDGTPQMFNERTKYSFINAACQKILINDNLCFFHSVILLFSLYPDTHILAGSRKKAIDFSPKHLIFSPIMLILVLTWKLLPRKSGNRRKIRGGRRNHA